MRFHFPISGDMLNDNDGTLRDGRLYVKVQIAAHPQDNIYVNRIPAKYDGQFFVVEVPLYGYRNILTVYNAATSESANATVYWLKNADNKARLSLDDNIYCFRDLAKNAGNYKSLFENPYFALYKKVNELYGTKVHVNVYYQCEDFNLTMMPDKYKPEFTANSNWLQFSFHALQDQPERPYKHTDFDTILHDYDLVTEQLIRFAGEECVSPVTTVHWGECTREGVRALRARGLRALMGYFQYYDFEPYVSYYFDIGHAMRHNKRDFWKDEAEDMIFGRIYHVLNLDSVADIAKIPHYGGFMELMIHEQHFYPWHEHYMPDFEERVMVGAKFAADNGYKSAWVQDCVLE